MDNCKGNLRALAAIGAASLLALGGCVRLYYGEPPYEAKSEAAAPVGAAPAVAVQPPTMSDLQWLEAKADPSTFDPARLEAEIFRQTNAFRAENGRAPLRVNPLMGQTARGHSEEMARRGVLDHRSPTSGRRTAEERLASVGLDYRVSAENIAFEPCVRFWTNLGTEFNTWREVAANTVLHWSKSPGHRANMLRSEVTEMGLGVALAERKGQPYVYITQNFRRPWQVE